MQETAGMSGETAPTIKESVFPCFCCGVCCSGYQVEMDLDEAQRIAGLLDLPWQEFVNSHVDPRWPGARTLVLRHDAGKCVFLDQEADSSIGLCRIHAFKPKVCIEWKASSDRKECRQGLSRFWNLTVGEDGQVVGAPDALLSFQTYLDTITREEHA
jgi:Fe-S-cluster containining protein